MNVPVIEKWIEALRSGKYQQTRTVLRESFQREPQYCCLGVLCELYAAEKGIEWRKGTSADSILGADSRLPEAVKQWAGITQDHQDKLINMNDVTRYSFNQIAGSLQSRLTRRKKAQA